jgi:hypothetical protein
MRPKLINILSRSFSLPSTMRFSSPASAFSILFTKLGIPDDGDHRFRAIVIAVPG